MEGRLTFMGIEPWDLRVLGRRAARLTGMVKPLFWELSTRKLLDYDELDWFCNHLIVRSSFTEFLQVFYGLDANQQARWIRDNLTTNSLPRAVFGIIQAVLKGVLNRLLVFHEQFPYELSMINGLWQILDYDHRCVLSYVLRVFNPASMPITS